MKSTQNSELKTQIQRRYRNLRPHLTERQRRLFAASEAKALGHGGVSLVADATGLSRTTIHQGLTELQRRKCVSEPVPSRRPGGGRKNIAVFDPDILTALERLIEASSGFRATHPLRWTCRSMRDLATELSRNGHPVSHASVGQLMRILGYRVRGNSKTREEGSSAERATQFRHVQQRIDAALRKNRPVLRCCLEVEVRDQEAGAPSGNGSDEPPEWAHAPCTPQAVARAAQCLRRWWEDTGAAEWPEAASVTICTEARGCDGSRIGVWQEELRRFAAACGLELEVHHLPPGASRWTRIRREEECWALSEESDREIRVRVSVASITGSDGCGPDPTDPVKGGEDVTFPESVSSRWSYRVAPSR